MGRLSPAPRYDFAAKADAIAEAFAHVPEGPPPVDLTFVRRENLKRSGLFVPADDLADILADRIGDTLAMRETTQWAGEDRRAFLLLTGPPGRGKTVACGWTLAARGGFAISAPDLIALDVAATRGDWKARDRLDNLHEARLVVLDELARHPHLQPGEETAIFNFVNKRQGPGRKRTLITTNRGVDELAERYDFDPGLVTSRLLGHGRAVLLDSDPDWRELRFTKGIRPPPRKSQRS